MEFEIKDCQDYEVAKELIREYSTIKGAEQCFVSLNKELADLDAFYQGGALLIGYEHMTPVATIAIRKVDDHTCEVKRLYIKPSLSDDQARSDGRCLQPLQTHGV